MSVEFLKSTARETSPRGEPEKLLQYLLNSGLEFHQAIEELELYSEKSGVRELRELGIQSNIYTGMWSFAVSSKREYPFGKKERPFYRERLLWAFGLKEGPREGILGRKTKRLDEDFWWVRLHGSPTTFNSLEFEARDDWWRLNSRLFLEAKEPLGTVAGEKLDTVNEEISLGGKKTEGPTSLTISREIGVGPLSIKFLTHYDGKDDETGAGTGLFVPSRIDREIKTISRSRQELLSLRLRELEAAEKKLFDSFSDQVNPADLMREKIKPIIEYTSQTIEALRDEKAK